MTPDSEPRGALLKPCGHVTVICSRPDCTAIAIRDREERSLTAIAAVVCVLGLIGLCVLWLTDSPYFEALMAYRSAQTTLSTGMAILAAIWFSFCALVMGLFWVVRRALGIEPANPF